MTDDALAWDKLQLGAAAHQLLGVLTGKHGSRLPPAPRKYSSDVASALRAMALESGYVAEPVDFYEADVAALLRRDTPVLFVPTPASDELFVIVRSNGRTTTLLSPNGALATARTSDIAWQLRSGIRQRAAHVCRVLQGTSDLGDATRLCRSLQRELSEHGRVGSGFAFRPRRRGSTSGPEPMALGLGGLGLRLFALSLLTTALTAVAWLLIGSLALRGHADRGSLSGWALLCCAAAALQVVSTIMVGRFTLKAATRIRQRLLGGALRLDAEELGAIGLGGLVVLASQADAFLLAVIACVLAALATASNVLAALIVLGAGPLPLLGIFVFAGFVVGVCVVARRLKALALERQSERLRLTTEMVERMIGHRTRLIQQAPAAWHEGEDESLLAYAHHARTFDRWSVSLRALPRSYYAAAIASSFMLLAGQPTPEALALTAFGVLLGMTAIASLVELAVSGTTLHALFDSMRRISSAAAEAEAPATVRPVPLTADVPSAEDAPRFVLPIVELRHVGFSHVTSNKPTVTDANLRVAHGDRILIEGPSGGGKTTLANLVAGLLKPNTGLTLVKGLDHHSVVEADLRRVIATAPQFYRNHLFTESLAFNLLLGRNWPPHPEDLQTARELARALGLGPLLERMPAELFQQVGATGWQLSHGERSRIFLARTLLQRAELIVLDETFGTLDPATLQECMSVVLQRAPTLVVITHR